VSEGISWDCMYRLLHYREVLFAPADEGGVETKPRQTSCYITTQNVAFDNGVIAAGEGEEIWPGMGALFWRTLEQEHS